jgi:glutamine synthetase
MKIIDKYYICKEIVACFFKKRGYIASFLPKVFKDCGNGSHAHLSIWKNGKNHFGDIKGRYGVSKDGEHFMAGVLKYIDVILHFLAPSSNSLKRIKPYSFVGAYKYWGRENREAPLKLVLPNRPGDVITNFEVKSFDHTCNMYFAMACVIAMGAQGLKDKN